MIEGRIIEVLLYLKWHQWVMGIQDRNYCNFLLIWHTSSEKTPTDKQLSEAWLYLWLKKCHNDIAFIKPRPRNISRTKSVTEEAVGQYFQK